MYDLLIKNGRLVTPDRIFEAEIAIQDGKYAAFLTPGTEVDAQEVIDAEGNLVFPGMSRDSSTEKISKPVPEPQLLRAAPR